METSLQTTGINEPDMPNSNEPDIISALAVIPEEPELFSDNSHIVNGSTDDYPYGKEQGMLVSVEREVIEKKKYKVAAHKPSDLTWLIPELSALMMCITGAVYIPSIYKDSSFPDPDDILSIIVRLILTRIVPITLYICAPVLLLVLLSRFFGIKKVKGKSKIKEKVTEMHAPYPDEFGKKSLPDNGKAKKQDKHEDPMNGGVGGPYADLFNSPSPDEAKP